MKNKITLVLGGELSTGDVVGISYNNYMVFGWFVESGQYGSLKYISFRTANTVMNQFNDFQSGKIINSWYANRFKNGLSFKSFHKDYIVNLGGPSFPRAFKVSNPEEFFKDSPDFEIMYLEGKEQLNKLNFPAK